MKHYTVVVKEILLVYYQVDAESPEDARARVADGFGTRCASEHLTTLPSDTWSVRETKEWGSRQ